MSTAEMVDVLRDIEFLSDVGDDSLQRLAEIAQIADFPQNFEIFRENEYAKNVYMIVSGRISLAICNAKLGCRQLMEVSDGEMFGWSPLVGRKLLSDSAFALTSTRAVAFDGEALRDLCASDNTIGYEIMRRTAQTLAERLNAVRWQLFESYGYELPTVQIESD